MNYVATIFGEKVRDRIIEVIRRAPLGARVELHDEQRSLEQNAKMWALLNEIAAQKTHCGRRYDADQWKAMFMHALGQEVQFLPALDGSTFIPYSGRSSKMSRKEMSELIEFILAWGAQHGVVFADDQRMGEREGIKVAQET